MTQTVPKPSQNPRGRCSREGRPAEIEGMALVALRTMSPVEMARVSKALEREGISGVRLARLHLSRTDARRVAEGGSASILATFESEDDQAVIDETPEQGLERALREARARGDALKRDLLAAPEMLSTAAMAERLGMSSEGVRLKRKRHEVLGVDFAKRGIRYPEWQVLENRRLLPALPRLFSILGEDSWAVYRFLLQTHPELGGCRALDALKRGRGDDVLAVASNVTAGVFA